MSGKELKVAEYNLTFGETPRFVNVFSVFRYKKNNNLYLIYTDIGTNYNIIYYGSSHIKNNSILSMTPKQEDEEIIKEFIFKITSNEALDNFEIIDLSNIEEVEIISSARLEVKPEIITSLTEKTIPKKEVKEEIKQPRPKKKSVASKLLTIIIILAIIFGGIYLYLSIATKTSTVAKTITCTKSAQEKTIKATIEETSTYNFNNKDILENVETVSNYKFNTKEDYEDFIRTGTIYKYMPKDDTDGGFKQDDDKNIFTIITKETIGLDYSKPINYEEVLSYYKGKGYTCDEAITE